MGVLRGCVCVPPTSLQPIAPQSQPSVRVPASHVCGGWQEGVSPVAVAQGRADHVMEAVLSKADGEWCVLGVVGRCTVG